MSLFLLFGGLIGLLIAAQLLIEGTLDLAHRFKISEFIIGLTVLTIGTSVPELTVSLIASVHRLGGEQNSDLIVGQIVGSNIGNIGLILGLAGLFGVLLIKHKFLFIQGVFLIGAIVYFLLVGQDGLVDRGEGLVGLGFYFSYILILPKYVNLKERRRRKIKYSAPISIGLFLFGLAGVILTADWVVRGGVGLANSLGISQSLIGIFLIGLGTSLPELVVTLTAVIKKSNGLSVGNLIGSNIFNVMVSLSSSAIIADLKLTYQELRIDLPFLLLLSVVVSLFFYTKEELDRKESLLILALYFIYLSFKLVAASY